MGNKASVVLGIGFGDEGKGLVTDFVCSKGGEETLVVRYSGGQQAGHTVVRGGMRHVFSNFGSGTLLGMPTYWARSCTFDPVGVMREFEILRGMGLHPVLYADADCPVTTPYEKMRNMRDAEFSGHGTCGVGVGATMDREDQHYSLLVGDLFSNFVLRSKMGQVREYHSAHYKNRPKLFDKTEWFASALSVFYESVSAMIDKSAVRVVRKMPGGYGRYVFESSQGLMLDPSIGFFPHVTRIPVGTPGMLGMGMSASTMAGPHVYLVTRAYVTRHGSGPMPNDGAPHGITPGERETNVTNKWQGDFRIGMLDLDTLKYAISRDDYARETDDKTLVITCLDHVRFMWKYTSGGRIIVCESEDDFVNDIMDGLGVCSVLVSRGPSAEDVARYVR